MPVPERVPLPAADDRAQRVILQQQHSARRQPGRTLGEGPALVRGVHQAEAVNDHVSLPAGSDGTSPRALSRPSQDPPCGLPYSATTPLSGSNPAA